MSDVISVWCIIAYLIHAGMGLYCYDKLSGVTKLGFFISLVFSPLSLFVMLGAVISTKIS